MYTNREIFDRIAESWYGLRHWPRMREELDEVAWRWGGGKLLNVGCAHGPDFLSFRQNFELWGIDFSRSMLKQAIRYSNKFDFYVNLTVACAQSLPFPDNTFDCAISIATYHHIEGDGQRKKAFAELKRVLKPGAEAFITVWNRGQRKFLFKSKEQLVPWRTKEKTFYRYYHLFSYGELRKLLKEAGFEVVEMSPEKSYRFPIKGFSRNICALVRKPG